MITCTRRLTFCAGHRVMGHGGKCAHLHGHNYVAEVTAVSTTPASVDALGMVVDFSVIKEYLGAWLDTNFDHGFIVSAQDVAAFNMLEAFEVRSATTERGITLPACKQKLYVLSDNPTAENIARHLLLCICPRLFADTSVRITHIRLHETENCFVDVTC